MVIAIQFGFWADDLLRVVDFFCWAATFCQNFVEDLVAILEVH